MGFLVLNPEHVIHDINTSKLYLASRDIIALVLAITQSAILLVLYLS